MLVIGINRRMFVNKKSHALFLFLLMLVFLFLFLLLLFFIFYMARMT